MNYDHLIGSERTITAVVEYSMTASAVGSGGVDVLATPQMILLFEKAARDAVQAQLPPGETTVGTMVSVSHFAATPMGEEVRATARVTKVDGRRIVYSVSASDQHRQIGEGTHERYVIDLDRFMKKLAGNNRIGLK
jgi:fluoroacetyl-CoA thioesterase